MQDRKYVDALVEQYLTPRHRQMTSKMKETKVPRIRKSTESSFKITEVKAKTRDPYIKPSTDRRLSKDISNSCSKCGSKILEGNTFCTNCGAQTKNASQPRKEELVPQPRKEELASKDPTIEEKFIEHVEKDRSSTKKSNTTKIAGIIIGVIAVIIIGGGVIYAGNSHI